MAQSLWQGCSWDICQGCSRFRAQLGRDPLPSSHMWLLESQVRWVLSGDTGSLPRGPLQRTAHNMAADFPQSRDSQRERKQNRSQVFLVTQLQKWAPITSAVFYLLKASQYTQPLPEEGMPQDLDPRRQGSPESILEAVSTCSKKSGKCAFVKHGLPLLITLVILKSSHLTHWTRDLHRQLCQRETHIRFFSHLINTGWSSGSCPDTVWRIKDTKIF